MCSNKNEEMSEAILNEVKSVNERIEWFVAILQAFIFFIISIAFIIGMVYLEDKENERHSEYENVGNLKLNKNVIYEKTACESEEVKENDINNIITASFEDGTAIKLVVGKYESLNTDEKVLDRFEGVGYKGIHSKTIYSYGIFEFESCCDFSNTIGDTKYIKDYR